MIKISENKFDKEKIEIVDEYEVPGTFCSNGKIYNIKEAKQKWWQCPKCGSNNIIFDSNVEEFNYDDENQFTSLEFLFRE